jgi:signal transduction histidine kinase
MRLKIRDRVIAVACAVFALLALTQYIVQREMLLPRFAQLERKHSIAAMDSVSIALARQTDILEAFARDWGNWSLTYTFMHDHDVERLRDDMGVDSMTAFHANLVVLIDMDGRIVHVVGFDPVTQGSIAVERFAGPALEAGDPLRALIGVMDVHSGVVQTRYGLMLIASAPILNGVGQGPVAGMLLLGHSLSINELAASAKLEPGDLAAVPSGNGPRDMTPVLIDGASTRVEGHIFENATRTTIIRDLPALDGHSRFALRLSLPRELTFNALDMIRVDSLLLVALAATALLSFVVFLSRAVLKPLAEITEHATAIGDSDDLTRRLNRSGSDELATLASALDQMVSRLAQARSELIEKSFVAGIAEMASGALHNLGNALTPLSVRVSALQQRLRGAAVEDVARATEELAGPGLTPARRADVTAFALLAGRELAASVEAARADSDVAARQLQTIQRLLTDQVRQSRAGTVVEQLTLSTMLTQSLDLVPPGHRARLAIEVAAEVAELPPLRLPSMVLRQVFQNLVVNAAEACVDYPARTGRLRISAAIVADAGGERLSCRFEDDGSGIPADVLARLFQRQYSTKSTSTNSGIGLHWCANALRALGGEIRASSEGPGMGAVFQVVVPLSRDTHVAAAIAA